MEHTIQIPRKKRPKAELDIAPMIDVVFLLLMFFMLTSTFIEQRAIELLLPNSEAAHMETEQQFLRVQLLVDGSFALDDVPQTNALVVEAVQTYLATQNSVTILLEADLRCSVQQMVDAMDILSAAGATQVNLVTETIR